MNNKNLPQNWDFFMCRIEGAPASIRTNLALIEVAPLEGLTQRLQFYIKMQNPRPDGLSSNEEYPILCDIEDALGDKAEAIGAILAGVMLRISGGTSRKHEVPPLILYAPSKCPTRTVSTANGEPPIISA